MEKHCSGFFILIGVEAFITTKAHSSHRIQIYVPYVPMCFIYCLLTGHHFSNCMRFTSVFFPSTTIRQKYMPVGKSSARKLKVWIPRYIMP